MLSVLLQARCAEGAGVKQGPTRTYDPFGNPVRGTTPDNLAGSFDWGWLGGAGRPVEHEGALQPTIEMGARQYSPRIGRFLEVDPIEGGSCNDYDYTCGDPLNEFDLDGTDIFGISCQSCADFASGALDTVTFGQGRRIESTLGIDDRVRYDSGWRKAGIVVGAVLPAPRNDQWISPRGLATEPCARCGNPFGFYSSPR